VPASQGGFAVLEYHARFARILRLTIIRHPARPSAASGLWDMTALPVHRVCAAYEKPILPELKETATRTY
jgi:hypothetical protein